MNRKYLGIGVCLCLCATGGGVLSHLLKHNESVKNARLSHAVIEKQLTSDEVISTVEESLKIKELDRFVGKSNVVIYGKTGDDEGVHCNYNKATKTFSKGDEIYYVQDGKVLKLGDQKGQGLRFVVLPKIARDYGFVLGNGAGSKIAYVIADTSCPYSQRFFTDGGAKNLMRDGYRVVVIPVSRKVDQNELLSLSVFSCSNDEKQKRDIFIKAIDSKIAIDLEYKKPPKGCNYWSDLKQFYSLFDDYDFDGFPAIIKSNTSDISHIVE